MNLTQHEGTAPVTRKELERALDEMRSFVLALVCAGEGEKMRALLEGVEMGLGREAERDRCEGCGEPRGRASGCGKEERWEKEDGEEDDESSDEESISNSSSISSSISNLTSSSSSSSSYPPPLATSQHLDLSQSSPAPLAAHAPPATIFLSHVSHPHGSLVEPGSSFVKTWRFRNSSSQALHPHSALRFLSGSILHSCLPLQHVGPIPAGEEFEVSVAMRAPKEEGQWKAAWVMDDLEEVVEGGRGRLEVEVWILTGSPSSTYFPSSHFPQLEPTVPQPDFVFPPRPSSPLQSSSQVRYDHLSDSISNIELSASVDWSESGWDDGCTGDDGAEVDEGVEDLVRVNLGGEDWTEVRWTGEGER